MIDEQIGTERSKSAQGYTESGKVRFQPRQPGSEFLPLAPMLQQTLHKHCIICTKHGADLERRIKKIQSPNHKTL